MQCNIIRSYVLPAVLSWNPLARAIKKTPNDNSKENVLIKGQRVAWKRKLRKLKWIEKKRREGKMGAWSRASGLKFICKQSDPTNPDSLPRSVCHGFSISCPKLSGFWPLVYLCLRLRLHFGPLFTRILPAFYISFATLSSFFLLSLFLVNL